MFDLEMQRGKIIALQGDTATVSTLLISMAVRLQGKSRVLYIDSAHTFSPAFVSRHFHKRPEMSLSRLSIARPLSPDQLLGVVKKLDGAIRETRAKSVVVSSLDGPFCGQPQDNKDLEFTFSEVMAALREVSLRHGLMVLVGISPQAGQCAPGAFSAPINEGFDMVCRV